MAFAIPNYGNAAYPDQAEPDAVDFDILALSFQRTGVLSGCAVSAQGTPNKTVAVAVGTVLVAGATVAVAAGNLTLDDADGTNPRFDLIAVNSSGVKAVTKGTAAANPVFPAAPAGSAVLASVYLPAGSTVIVAGQITDKRVVISPWNPSTFNVKDFGAVGDGTTDDTTAIQLAYNAANAFGGGLVLYPVGRYKTTAAVTCYANTVSVGQGRNSVFVLTDISQDGLVFDPSAAGISVENMRFQVDGVAKTSGATIKLVGNKKCHFKDVWFDGHTEEDDRHYRCMSITGVARFISCISFDMTSISATSGAAGIFISQDSGGWGYYFTNGTIQTSSKADGSMYTTPGDIGLYLAAIDGARFSAIEFIALHTACVLIKPPASGYMWVTHVRFIGCAIEVSGENHYALDLNATTADANVISKVFFVNTTIYGGPINPNELTQLSQALHINVNRADGGTARQVNEIHFIACNFSYKILIEHSGTSNDLADLRVIDFTNCSCYGPSNVSTYLITIDGQLDRWSMIGCHVEVAASCYGLTVTNTAHNTNYAAIGNDFTGVASVYRFVDLNTGTGRKVRLGNMPQTLNTTVARSVTIQAERFKAIAGAVSGMLGGGYDCLSTRVMDKATNGHCIASLILPALCLGYVAINVHWAMPDASAGNVYWSVDYKLLIAGDDVTAAGTTVQSTIASGTLASKLKIWAVASGIAAVQGQPNLLRIDVRRDGTQGTDTCAASVHFIGVEILWLEYNE